MSRPYGDRNPRIRRRDPLRIRQELLARLRKPHPPTRPHEQRIPKLLLERLESRRQSRLRKIHLLRRPAQISQPRHRQKAFDLPEEHAVSLRSPACQHVPFGDSQHAPAAPPLSAFQLLALADRPTGGGAAVLTSEGRRPKRAD